MCRYKDSFLAHLDAAFPLLSSTIHFLGRSCRQLGSSSNTTWLFPNLISWPTFVSSAKTANVAGKEREGAGSRGWGQRWGAGGGGAWPGTGQGCGQGLGHGTDVSGGVGLGALLQQLPHQVRVAVGGGEDERRGAILRGTQRRSATGRDINTQHGGNLYTKHFCSKLFQKQMHYWNC